MTCVECDRPLFDGERSRCESCKGRRLDREQERSSTLAHLPDWLLTESAAKIRSDRPRGYA